MTTKRSGPSNIFITGAGSGIGAATARYFAAKGWIVGLADKDGDRVEAVGREIGAAASVYVMDVTEPGEWAHALREFTSRTGGALDVLFNNAGVAVGGPLAATSDEDITRCVSVNLVGMIVGAKAAFNHLAKGNDPCLVNCSSATALYGAADAAVYSASKYGIRGLTEALDLEWSSAGIKVRSIMPAFVDTPMLDALVEETDADIRSRVETSGLELSSPDQVAASVWQAIHGGRLHTPVGRTARLLSVAARLAPGLLRWQLKRQAPL